MIVAIAPAGPAALAEQDDFKGLKVTLTRGDTVERALALLGASEAAEVDHIWIRADALRALATRSAEWGAAFAAMLAKVAPYGWYDPALARVKAHVERAA